MHFESWRPVEKHSVGSHQQPNKIVSLLIKPHLFVYLTCTNCSLQKFIKNKNGWRCRYHTGHATISNALVKNCFWSSTTTFLIVFRGSQKLYFAIENHFWLSDCIFAFFKNLKSGSYEPSHSVHWLEHRLVFFLNNNGAFFSFFLLLITCELGSFYALLETRRFLWAHWKMSGPPPPPWKITKI